MFFSIMPKIVLTFFFVKLYFCLFNFESELFSVLFFVCGFLSVVIGIINAMYQYKIKRFLAYSSITTVGFVLISFSTMTFDGFFSGLYFIFCYIVSVCLLFFILLNIRKNNMKELNELFDLSLISNSNPLLCLLICFIFLSFAGIPPLIGFFGKFFIFFSLFNSFNYFILFILLFLSIISSFYYLRVIRFIYFTKVYEYGFYNYFNLNYMFFFIFYFNVLFFLFFDYFGEFIYFVLIKAFM
jgi:NADH-quinone oxidoreductase subunit N